MKLTAGRIAAVGGLAATASMVLLMAGADAHHPEVSASAPCEDETGRALVQIKAESWSQAGYGDEHRYNANVSVSFDGVTVGSGAFLPSNNFSFTVKYSAKADGATHTVRATAVAGFGPVGEFGSAGEFRESTVKLPIDCKETAPTTTTTKPVTTTTTTTPPATTTTVPTEVGGVVQSRPDVAAPIVVVPRFAG